MRQSINYKQKGSIEGKRKEQIKESIDRADRETQLPMYDTDARRYKILKSGNYLQFQEPRKATLIIIMTMMMIILQAGSGRELRMADDDDRTSQLRASA